MNGMGEEREFDFESVFEVDDYLYFYQDRLTEERTEKEVEFLVRELGLSTPKKILDLACGHGRHSNSLAKLGHRVTGVDITQGFLEARRNANKLGVDVIVHEERYERYLIQRGVRQSTTPLHIFWILQR
jgi:2-polyprenyl-3-methyl-5-hydroxy-6-metoxy-1,4-benzoquinol methylase